MRAARFAVADIVPNSCFPAIAAIVLDLFNREGLDVMHELIFPNYKACHWAICAPRRRCPREDVV